MTANHRLTFTLRERRPHEAELWQALEPMLKKRTFQAYIIDLLVTELLLTDEEREQRRRMTRLIEQAVWHGEPGSSMRTLKELISTAETHHEGGYVELKADDHE